MGLRITWPTVGQRLQNKLGHWYTVVEIKRSDDILVEFDEDKVQKRTQKCYIEDGSVYLPKVRVGQWYKDKLGSDVQIVAMKDTNNITFRWQDGYERTCKSAVISLGTIMREEDSQRITPAFKVGSTGTLKDGTKWEILEYNGVKDIKIRVYANVVWEANVHGGNLASGSVKNKGNPSLFGVGIIGEGFADSSSHLYKSWAGMLKRVYNPHTKAMETNYGDCSVHSDWFLLTNYATWFNKQVKESNWQLDKDLLFPGNKEYHPDKCVFLPREVNTFLTNRYNHRGMWPVGVTYHERINKWQATCNVDGKSIYLGVFTSPDAAFVEYKKTKEQWAKDLAERWKGQIDDRAYIALKDFSVNIDD